MSRFFRVLLGQSGGGGGGGGAAVTKTFTIDHTKAGGSDLTNFPMRVNYTNASLKTTGNGGVVTSASGYDILFTSDFAGTTNIKWDMISYDGSAGTIVADVRIPSLSASSDTVIYLQAGDASITTYQGDRANTWDANFQGVYHMWDGSALALTDPTSNANNGTQNNGVTGTSSGVGGGGAASFAAASTQYITTANTVNIAQPTIEAWVKIAAWPGGNPGTIAGVVQGNGGGTADKTLAIRTDGKVHFYAYDGGVKTAISSGTVTTGSFQYIVATGDGSNLQIYINASADGSTACGNTYTGYTGAGFEIQGLHGGSVFSTYADITIAEVRLSNIARSSGWITATYNSINSPSTFYTVT